MKPGTGDSVVGKQVTVDSSGPTYWDSENAK